LLLLVSGVGGERRLEVLLDRQPGRGRKGFKTVEVNLEIVATSQACSPAPQAS
jgi:hypothetical protein